MSTINVELPEDLHHFVEAKVQRSGFGSANEYIVALVDAARSKRSDIEAALLDGIHSGPPQEWTPEEWTAMKQRVLERHPEG